MRCFTKKGWFYLPVSLPGAIISFIAVAADIWFFIAIDKNAHSGSDTLIAFLPYFISIWVIFSFIASNSSNNSNIKQHDKFKNDQSGQLRY